MMDNKVKLQARPEIEYNTMMIGDQEIKVARRIL